MTLRRYGSLKVETANEDKVLFPDDGITKGDLIAYAESVASSILPHLAERPLVMQRFPDGIEREGFFHKQVPGYFPEWIPRVRVRTASGHQDLVLCRNAATLAYLADQGCITLHGWCSRADALDSPDRMVIDLDPPGDAFDAARKAALDCRDLLEELHLPSFPGLTGSRGMHVVVPLDRSLGFDRVREFARRFARELAGRHPDRLTVEQRKEKRGDRVYLDVGRNAYAQTAAMPYTVRPLPGAPVATPLRWSETASGEIRESRAFTVTTILRRLSRLEDPWKGMRRHAVSLAARGRFAELPS